jgi:hypothetical protein
MRIDLLLLTAAFKILECKIVLESKQTQKLLQSQKELIDSAGSTLGNSDMVILIDLFLYLRIRLNTGSHIFDPFQQ